MAPREVPWRDDIKFGRMVFELDVEIKVQHAAPSNEHWSLDLVQGSKWECKEANSHITINLTRYLLKPPRLGNKRSTIETGFEGN